MKVKVTRDNRLFLIFLSVCDRRQRAAILQLLTESQLQLLVEIIWNFIKGTLPISKTAKRLLYLSKGSIRKVVQSQNN